MCETPSDAAVEGNAYQRVVPLKLLNLGTISGGSEELLGPDNKMAFELEKSS